MYENWKIEDWRTPVSDIEGLQMVSLCDDNRSLAIIVQGLIDPVRRRFRISFNQYPAYRNINESYRNELWNVLSKNVGKWGRTFIVTASPWIESFSKETLLFNHPEITHYVICTEDDVIEVLSPEPPEIAEIEPAAEREELPGKSEIYWK